MAKIKNQGVVPQGMLMPSGNNQTPVNPAVQSTVRPPGSLLAPSPGYEGTVREGKNIFQPGGKGVTGGFRPSEFAEDIGGTGAAISVIPGDTAPIANAGWLPTDEGDIDEGTIIIADRGPKKRFAHILHEAEKIIPDMGDRSPGRPRSREAFLFNPIKIFREDYKDNKIATVIAAAGVVVIAYMVGNDLEREYKSRKGSGIVSGTAAVPEAGAATGEDVIDKSTKAITDTVEKATKAIERVADSAVNVIDGKD